MMRDPIGDHPQRRVLRSEQMVADRVAAVQSMDRTWC